MILLRPSSKEGIRPTRSKFITVRRIYVTAFNIDGLWGLAFGNGAQAGATNELFFTAGLNDEADGLFGKIVSNEKTLSRE